LIRPATPTQLAEALATAAASQQPITLGGSFSKLAPPAVGVTISTSALNRILQYEPRDLTISVEAGTPFAEITRVLAEHRQMIPLDPPFAEQATIGGVLALDQCGPRRRLYGSARDMTIGMTFATLEGKLVQTGGMVVKNVAGLDMSKLLIGSRGTLAAMASINFRVHPIPPASRTFVRHFAKMPEAMEACSAALKSVLQPAAIDLLKSAKGYQVLIQAGGNREVLERYARDLPGAGMLEGEAEEALWTDIREMTARFVRSHPGGAVVRIACKLMDAGKICESLPTPSIARAGSGIVYGYFEDPAEAARVPGAVFEYGQGPAAGVGGADFEIMKKIKHLFDPRGLLNRGMLHGRI
jgi:glycolate oxidase FAD binding subunit